MGNNFKNKLLYLLQEHLLYGSIVRRKEKSDFSGFLKELGRSESYSPIFFLSTGRSGTMFISDLIDTDKSFFVNHSNSPELVFESRVLYENYVLNPSHISSLSERALLMLGRGELLYEVEEHSKIYVETNNKITFFAHIINEVIPNARFVYMYRHPGEFIRSGIRRNWYSGDHPQDYGRISPVLGKHKDLWNNYSVEEKIGWLWNETNTYIESVMANISTNQIFKLNFSNLNEHNVRELLDFIDVKVDQRIIKNSVKKPVNAQKKGDYPHYMTWSDQKKKRLVKICGTLMEQYGYDFSC